MSKVKAVLLLGVIAIVSVLTVLYTGVSAAFYSMPVAENSNTSPMLSTSLNSTTTGQESSSQTAETSSSEVSSTTQNSSTANTSSAAAVIETHTVSGKIVTRFIDPTSAALAYDNIYIKNNTGTAINIKTELESEFNFKLSDSSEPQVLIVHTHATESYMLENRDYYTKEDASRSTDKSKNMVAVGKKIAEKLRDAGINVLHDTTLHDYPSYSGSYNASAATINSYLKKHPSIKVVLDVHRDAIGGGGNDKTKLVKNVDGKAAAQVMLVMGSQTGVVTTYPNWKQNLRLAMRFHQTIENMYPGLARPLLLVSKKYNQNLCTGGMLIEIGTDANTLEEALYSGQLVGNALAKLLNNLK